MNTSLLWICPLFRPIRELPTGSTVDAVDNSGVYTVNTCFCHARHPRAAAFWRRSGGSRSALSDVDLFGHFQRIVDLDAQVADRAVEIRVTEQQLNRPQVLRATVDQRRFGAAQ